MANTHKKHWFNQKRWRVALGIVLAVLLLIGIRSIYLNKQIAEEKKAFDASFVEVQKRADRLSAEFKPTTREDAQTCDYASQKFSKGSLSCNVRSELTYSNVSVKQANEIMNKSTKINPGTPLAGNSVGTIKNVPYFYDLSVDEADRHVAQLVVQRPSESDPMKCFSSFRLSSSEKNYNLLVTYSCSRNAKAEHYPVVE